MALRLISGRDGFLNFLSRFNTLRGHLDQTRPYSSYNVRKQISIGCYYDHSVFTPFKPARFELLGRTEDEYKCNRGIKTIKFVSYSVYTTSSQRPYSVHTTFPQRLYSTHDVFTARKQLLQRVHSAHTARSRRIQRSHGAHTTSSRRLYSI